MAVKENPYKKYLREDRLPHIFCPGCGNGIVMNAFFKGLEGSEVDFDNVSMVSGIGCSEESLVMLNAIPSTLLTAGH